MRKINELLRTEGEAAETVPTPTDGQRKSANRSVMFSVRFNAEELEELQRHAEQRGLPARTLARAWILERLREEGEETGDLSQRVARLEEAVFRLGAAGADRSGQTNTSERTSERVEQISSNEVS